VIALSFYDHHRMGWADSLSIPEFGEFMVGDYGEHGGVAEGGEFKILIHDHRHVGGGGLAPQVCVYGDGQGSFLEFVRRGGLAALTDDVVSRSEFAARLVSLGLVDRSDKPVDEAAE
jgi:hypothetical protein